MFSSLCLILGVLLSTFDPASVDWQALGQQLGMVEAAEAPGREAIVQVDLLPDRDSAEHLADALRLRFADSPQLEIFVEYVAGESDLPPSYRVGIGPFSSFEAAELAHDQAQRAGVEGFVRAAPEQDVGC